MVGIFLSMNFPVSCGVECIEVDPYQSDQHSVEPPQDVGSVVRLTAVYSDPRHQHCGRFLIETCRYVLGVHRSINPATNTTYDKDYCGSVLTGFFGKMTQ